MKRIAAVGVTALAMMLTACGETEAAPLTGAEGAKTACEDELATYVSAPARIEYIDDIEPELDSGRTVNMGKLQIIPGDGAPEVATYGCATTHEADGTVAGVDVVMVGADENLGYNFVCDKFTTKEMSLENVDDCDNL